MSLPKQNQSSYQIKQLPSGLLRVSCQGRKCRTAIYFGVGFDENGLGVFEKAPQGILDVFELEAPQGSLPMPTSEQIADSYRALEESCLKLRKPQSTARSRRVHQEKQSEEPKHVIRYAQIRKLYSQIGLSMSDIADHFKMSRVTIRKILKSYEIPGSNVAELDNTIINRSKSNRKYSNESEIINFMKTTLQQRDFKGVVSVRFMIDMLKNRFGASCDFRRSKVAEMMKKAGLKYKNVKLELVKHADSEGLNEEQKIHLAKLVGALTSNKLLIFLDETYVSKQMIPKRIWATKISEARVKITPKDDRTTIVAACSLHGVEAFQIIFDSIDAVHYCIFLLTLREKLIQKYPGVEVIYIHDNARPHVGKICAEVFNGYPFIRQSAYSPRMNFIEYFFGFFKKRYRLANFIKKEDLRQDQLVLRAIEQVSNAMFSVCRHQYLEYCLKMLKQENLIN